MFARLASRSTAISARVSAPVASKKRYATVQDESGLKERVRALIPEKTQEIIELRKKVGSTVIGQCTVDQAYGGMRGVKSMVSDISLLDAEEGIRFRGLSIPECQDQLPKAEGGKEPLPEALTWLLLTGEVPTVEQTRAVTAELNKRAGLPDHVTNMLKAFPKDLHPMSQFSAGVLALQKDSLFAKAYQDGVRKSEYWDSTFEDALNLIAKLPALSASIYRNVYKDGVVAPLDPKLDYSANYARQLGFNDPTVDDLLRLYLVIHSDHEAGNVSAHTTHLVGSALSDPYLAFSAGLNGLAGPLHGLANQEVLSWLNGVQKELNGAEPTNENIYQAIKNTRDAGRVVPGFGHAVLRKTDPRYTAQREFALKHMPNDPLFKLVSKVYEVAPDALTKLSRTKNPYPNVDAHSGCLLMHYGITEQNFYTVMFGVSRALGVLSNQVWSRALSMPIERPKSVTTEWLKQNVKAE